MLCLDVPKNLFSCLIERRLYPKVLVIYLCVILWKPIDFIKCYWEHQIFCIEIDENCNLQVYYAIPFVGIILVSHFNTIIICLADDHWWGFNTRNESTVLTLNSFWFYTEWYMHLIRSVILYHDLFCYLDLR